MRSLFDVTLPPGTILGNLSNTTRGAEALPVASVQQKLFVDVKADYGAVGDGVTDDSTAILNAINSVPVGGVGRLYFPTGTYLVSSTLLFTARRWIVEGAGTIGTKILWNGSTSGTAVKFTSDGGGTGNTFFAVKNISIVNNVAVGTTIGLLLTSAASGSNSGQCIIEQVACTGFSDNLAIGESGGQSSSEVTLINYVGQNGTNGVHVQGANSLNINCFNCSLSGNSTGFLGQGTNSHYIYGGSCSANTSVDFDFESAGVFSIQNVRSENAARFLLCAGTSAFTSITLLGNLVTGSNLNVDNAEIKVNQGNFFILAAGNQFRGNFDLNSSSGEGAASLISNSTRQSTLMTTNGDVTYRHFGNYQIAANGTFSAYFPDRIGSQRGGTVNDLATLTWAAGTPSGVWVGSAPNTQTGATYSIGATDNTVIANRAGTVTVTFPSATTSKGRKLRFLTIQNQTVVSASSNVVPIIGGSATTAILSATAGKWADVECDGTNWQITAAN